MKSRTGGLAMVSLVVASAGAAAAASVPGGDAQSFEPVSRITQFYDAGPSADYRRWREPYPHYEGSIGEVKPALFKTPAQLDTYQAVIELSFTYRTRGQGPFFVSTVVDTGASGAEDGSADDLATLPATPLQLAPTTRTSTTVRTLVSDLEPDTTYRVRPEAQSVLPERAGRNYLNLRSLLVTVDLTPADQAQ